MTVHILLIESNNLAQTESLLPSLEQQGHQVCLAHSPSTAATNINANWPNLVIFNNHFLQPNLSSFHEAISQTNLNIPYLVVSGQNHLTPPDDVEFSVARSGKPEHLTQAIQKVITKQQNRFIRLVDLTVDCDQHQVLRNGTSYNLTPKEFKLLQLLLKNADQVSSRKSIMQEVWETDYLGDTRTLDVHIRWLREKIEENPSRPRHLITVRGVGYHFIAKPEEPAV